jgi:mono/diheme cytochrome c family protein
MITTGKGRMPKYGGKLSPEEIDTLVRQIKEARGK